MYPTLGNVSKAPPTVHLDCIQRYAALGLSDSCRLTETKFRNNSSFFILNCIHWMALSNLIMSLPQETKTKPVSMKNLCKISRAGKHLTWVLTAWRKLFTQRSFTMHWAAEGSLDNLRTAQNMKIWLVCFHFVCLRLQSSFDFEVASLLGTEWNWTIRQINHSSKQKSCLRNFSATVKQLGYTWRNQITPLPLLEAPLLFLLLTPSSLWLGPISPFTWSSVSRHTFNQMRYGKWAVKAAVIFLGHVLWVNQPELYSKEKKMIVQECLTMNDDVAQTFAP